MIVAGTGHRLGKRLSDKRALTGYEQNIEDDLLRLARGALKQYKPAHVISGGAIGWDMALAEAAVELVIPLTLAIPFIGYEKRWPEKSQVKLQRLKEIATSMKDSADFDVLWECTDFKIEESYNASWDTGVVVIAQGIAPTDAYRERNMWMVNHCNLMLALWDGNPKGGTAHTIRVAKHNVKVINLWSSWLKGRR